MIFVTFLSNYRLGLYPVSSIALVYRTGIFKDRINKLVTGINGFATPPANSLKCLFSALYKHSFTQIIAAQSRFRHTTKQVFFGLGLGFLSIHRHAE